MEHGTIVNIRPNRGDDYGFGTINPDAGGPGLIFYSRNSERVMTAFGRHLHNVRHAAARREKPFDLLFVGQRVRFVVGADPRRTGRACAERVQPEATAER